MGGCKGLAEFHTSLWVRPSGSCRILTMAGIVSPESVTEESHWIESTKGRYKLWKCKETRSAWLGLLEWPCLWLEANECFFGGWFYWIRFCRIYYNHSLNLFHTILLKLSANSNSTNSITWTILRYVSNDLFYSIIKSTYNNISLFTHSQKKIFN